jgi:hypothetical protein
MNPIGSALQGEPAAVTRAGFAYLMRLKEKEGQGQLTVIEQHHLQVLLGMVRAGHLAKEVARG